MSLLMEALRKAEQAKKTAAVGSGNKPEHDESPTNPATNQPDQEEILLVLEDESRSPEPPPEPFPSLSLETPPPVVEEAPAVQTEPTIPLPRPAPTAPVEPARSSPQPPALKENLAKRRLAQSLFTAKQSSGRRKMKPRWSTPALFAVILLFGIVIGLGGVFYLQHELADDRNIIKESPPAAGLIPANPPPGRNDPEPTATADSASPAVGPAPAERRTNDGPVAAIAVAAGTDDLPGTTAQKLTASSLPSSSPSPADAPPKTTAPADSASPAVGPAPAERRTDDGPVAAIAVAAGTDDPPGTTAKPLTAPPPPSSSPSPADDLPKATAPAVQTPAVQTPAVPTPAVQTPAVQVPAIPTQAVQTPAVQVPAIPTQAVQTPAVQTPAVPTPAVPTPAKSPATGNAPIAPPDPSAHPIRISRTTTPPRIAPLLAKAYQAYQNGDYQAAREIYQETLRIDGRHRGATLGMAAVALRQNQPDLARALYLQLLERDPHDPLAQAGLLPLLPAADDPGLESRLKLLIANHPPIASLHLALGNLYAAQSRWPEAQQAYFSALEAARRAPGGDIDPSYPFNLAISLERIGKRERALAYYSEALALAGQRPEAAATVNPSLIKARIADLSRERNE